MEGFGAIPVFVAVVENGGFSSAARILGVSKSAVSKRINQLGNVARCHPQFRTNFAHFDVPSTING